MFWDLSQFSHCVFGTSQFSHCVLGRPSSPPTFWDVATIPYVLRPATSQFSHDVMRRPRTNVPYLKATSLTKFLQILHSNFFITFFLLFIIALYYDYFFEQFFYNKHFFLRLLCIKNILKKLSKTFRTFDLQSVTFENVLIFILDTKSSSNVSIYIQIVSKRI